MDADEAARRPIGEHGRARARPERNRAVERITESAEPVADVELAARGRRLGLADSDRRREHLAPVAEQRRLESRPVDDQAGVNEPVAAERAPWHPAREVVRQDREPDSHPQPAWTRPLADDEDDVRRPLRGPEVERSDPSRAGARLAPR